MSTLTHFVLAFSDPTLEKAYAKHTFSRRLLQGKIALGVGSLLYLAFGALDAWIVPEGYRTQVWVIRLAALICPLFVAISMFTPTFERASFVLLASLAFMANLGFLLTLPLIPLDKVSLFNTAILLTLFANYCLVGTRFIYALACALVVVVVYNVIFITTHGSNSLILMTHNFFFLCVNAMGGAVGYLQEFHLRKLFLREHELEEERKKHLNRALHDSLTGLPNRELLHDRLQQALAQSHREENFHSCYFIDLNGFKQINDGLGHEMGDKVLQAVAAQLRLAVRETDTVARLGGDEFFVVCQDIRSDDVTPIALAQGARLLSFIKQTRVDGLQGNPLTASIGVCIVPYEGATVTKLISRADKAMYRAKLANSNGGCALATAQD
jgi:diguanylate cyclase